MTRQELITHRDSLFAMIAELLTCFTGGIAIAPEAVNSVQLMLGFHNAVCLQLAGMQDYSADLFNLAKVENAIDELRMSLATDPPSVGCIKNAKRLLESAVAKGGAS